MRLVTVRLGKEVSYQLSRSCRLIYTVAALADLTHALDALVVLRRNAAAHIRLEDVFLVHAAYPTAEEQGRQNVYAVPVVLGVARAKCCATSRTNPHYKIHSSAL